MPNITLCGECNRAARPGEFLCDVCAERDERDKALDKLRGAIDAAGCGDGEQQEGDK